VHTQASQHSTINHLILQQARSKSEVPQWAPRAATFTPNQAFSPDVGKNNIKSFRSKLSAYNSLLFTKCDASVSEPHHQSFLVTQSFGYGDIDSNMATGR
jgi:hypothetical protein